MAPSKKTGLTIIASIAMAVISTISRAHTGPTGSALHGAAGDPLGHFQTIFNPSAGRANLPHRYIGP